MPSCILSIFWVFHLLLTHSLLLIKLKIHSFLYLPNNIFLNFYNKKINENMLCNEDISSPVLKRKISWIIEEAVSNSWQHPILRHNYSSINKNRKFKLPSNEVESTRTPSNTNIFFSNPLASSKTNQLKSVKIWNRGLLQL